LDNRETKHGKYRKFQRYSKERGDIFIVCKGMNNMAEREYETIAFVIE